MLTIAVDAMPKSTKFPDISLAPIHEYTNAPFRLLCQRHGCKASFVPLVNVTAVIKGKLVPKISGFEKNIIVQLSGSEPEEFEESIKSMEKRFGNIGGFNINAGCPSHTTMKTGAGSTLMRKPELLAKIVKKCKETTSLPVSVKTRKFSDRKKTIEFYRKIENAGADYLIIHGRTVKQYYSGTADWDIIRAANENLSLPVIGNGDIRDLSEAKSRISGGFCSGIMVGRAALQNPKLFEGKKELAEKERTSLFLEYYGICEELGATKLKELKLVSAQLLKGIKDASRIREKIMKSKSLDEIFQAIDRIK